MLDGFDGVSPVHGSYYEMCSSYHKLMGNHAEYYRDALRFLGCTDLNEIPSMCSIIYMPGYPVIIIMIIFNVHGSKVYATLSSASTDQSDLE